MTYVLLNIVTEVHWQLACEAALLPFIFTS